MSEEESTKLPKPIDLGPESASQFKDESVVRAYSHRPSYPPVIFHGFADLITDEPRTVIDAGCDTGFIARPLVALVEGVDAVDSLPTC